MAGWLLGSLAMERCSALPETGSGAISLLRGWPGRGETPLARVIYEASVFKTLRNLLLL